MFVHLTDEEADIKQGLITIYTSQIIMLYTLNIYSIECQLYLSKTGRKNVDWNIHFNPVGRRQLYK